MQRIHRNTQPSLNSIHFKLFGALIALLFLGAGVAVTPAHAVTYTWGSNSGNWQDGSSWTGGSRPDGSNIYSYIIFGGTGTAATTATIDNVTADFYQNSMTNLGSGSGDGIVLGRANGATLVINYTNTNVALQLAPNAGTYNTIEITTGGTLSLLNGIIDTSLATNIAPQFWVHNSGLFQMTGGVVTSYNVHVGNNGTIDVQGGLLTTKTLNLSGTRGDPASGIGTFRQSGGTVDVTSVNGLTLGYGYRGLTGAYYLAGGTLNYAGGYVSYANNAVNKLIVSNGNFNVASTLQLTAPYYGVNILADYQIYGGTNEFSNGLWFNEYGNGTQKGVVQMYLDGGVVNITNGMAGFSTSSTNGSYVKVDNGLLNVKYFSADVPVSIHGGQVTVVNGGTMSVAGYNWQFPYGSIDVATNGVLEIINSAMTLKGAGLTNRDGGTVRFTGNNNPSITITSSAFVTTNATIEIKSADAINLAGNIGTLITYQGTNTLSFNNSTNAMVASFNLDNASAGVGAKFASLNLTNASKFQAGTLTNSAIGVVTLDGSSKLAATNTLVNAGLIRGSGSAPSVTTTALYNQATGVITGSVHLTVYNGLTNAGAIVLSGGGGATMGGGTVNNSGTISADSSSPVSITSTTLFNTGSGVITGLVSLTIQGGMTNAGAVQLVGVGSSSSFGGPVTNSGVMSFSGGATARKSGGDLLNSSNLVFSGGSSGTLSNDYLNNGGLISAAADSPVTVVANTVANHGTSAIITGRVTLLVSGGLTNNNVIQIENANLTVGGAMTNSGTVRLLNSTGNSFAAVDNSGLFEVSGSTAMFGGAVTNTGTVRMSNSLGTFNAVVVNNGAWINDPTTNTFLSGYTIGNAGSLSMASGDVFVFSGGNFANSSTQSNTYNTIDGKFVFSGGPGATQAFAVAGLNLAALTPTGTNTVGIGAGGILDPHSISYFQNNFALGTLEIAANTTVEVWNASSSPLAGLFLSNLVMGANSALIISNAVQVYYISTNAAMSSSVILLQPIQGLSGASGFHELIIPEPSTLLLGMVGLLVGWKARRRSQKSAVRGQRSVGR